METITREGESIDFHNYLYLTNNYFIRFASHRMYRT